MNSRQNEQRLIDLKFARWSVRGGTNPTNPTNTTNGTTATNGANGADGENTGGESIKAMKVDYRAAAAAYARAQQEGTALLEGRGAMGPGPH